jgi:hypothetical protein
MIKQLKNKKKFCFPTHVTYKNIFLYNLAPTKKLKKKSHVALWHYYPNKKKLHITNKKKLHILCQQAKKKKKKKEADLTK